jgi:hypothetical protein
MDQVWPVEFSKVVICRVEKNLSGCIALLVKALYGLKFSGKA